MEKVNAFGCVLSLAAVGLLVVLQCSDLRDRRLPNRLVASYAALCPLALWASGATPSIWLQHGIIAIAGFVVLLILFAMGGMGGGDVKLGAAVLAWSGVQSLPAALFVIGVTGLVLALLGLAADKLLASRSDTGYRPIRGLWQATLHALSVKRGVPYGVALALGGMVALPAYWP